MTDATEPLRRKEQSAESSSAPSWFAVRNPPFVKSVLSGDQANAPESGSLKKRRRKSVQGGQFCMADVALFLEKVYHLSGLNEHKAVDAVYDFMDNCLLEGDFSLCEAALKSAAPKKMALSATISFLIVTRRAKPDLPTRATFFYRALDALSNDPAAADDARALRKYE